MSCICVLDIWACLRVTWHVVRLRCDAEGTEELVCFPEFQHSFEAFVGDGEQDCLISTFFWSLCTIVERETVEWLSRSCLSLTIDNSGKDAFFSEGQRKIFRLVGFSGKKRSEKMLCPI